MDYQQQIADTAASLAPASEPDVAGGGEAPAAAAAFDESGRLGQDECAILARCVQNNRIFEHCMYNNYDFYCQSDQDKRVQGFGIETNRQLRGRTRVTSTQRRGCSAAR